MNRRIGALVGGLALALALPRGAAAARAAGPAVQSLTLTAGLTSLYDSNPIQYSDAQLSDFDSGLHPDRFSIDTRDDAILNPTLALAWERDEGRGRRHLLRLRGGGEFHDKDQTADFRSISALWRESFARDRRLTLGYYALPHYYLRQLLDEDVVPVPGLSRYRRAEFSLQIATLDWTQRLTRRTLIGFEYRYERRGYNPDFVERTSNLHEGGLDLDFVRLPHRGAIEVHGEYRVSKAKGQDSDPSVDPDVSYHGVRAGLGGRMEFARSGSWRFGGDAAYDLETRAYDSDRPTDRYHFGRDDVLNAAEVGLRLGYRPHWSLRGFWHFEDNVATLGAAAPPSSDAGSFREHQVGLAIEWTGAVWSNEPAAADEGDQ